MDLTDDELRGLVRDAIGRVQTRSAPEPTTAAHPHASQTLFVLPRGDDTGACLIEPTVRCNHCGYCASFGH